MPIAREGGSSAVDERPASAKNSGRLQSTNDRLCQLALSCDTCEAIPTEVHQRHSIVIGINADSAPFREIAISILPSTLLNPPRPSRAPEESQKSLPLCRYKRRKSQRRSRDFLGRKRRMFVYVF